MITQTYVRFPQPVTLDLRIATGPRPRVIPTDDATAPDAVPHEFTELPLHLHVDSLARTISAYLPPLPGRLELYGPEDFPAAAADTPEDHAERVLHLLGSDPATVLQVLIDGGEMPPRPPRIPREIPNWRAKAILATMGLTAQVEAIIGALPEPQRTVVTAAWAGDAKLARHGATVTALGSALGMSAAEIDSLFIAAEAIEI